MKGYNICGIQQIGIGVTDIYEAWQWYIDNFGMDCRIFEDETVAELMLPYTGKQPQSRHATLAMNLQSGGGFEIWQYKGRTPKVMEGNVELGDLGINVCKIKAKNIDKAYHHFVSKNITVINSPQKDPSGKQTFFVKDPFNNIFQIVEGSNWFMNEKKPTGGTCGAVIGVSDIEKALTVYSDILGYDQVVYDVSGSFDDLKNLCGGDKKVRRVLLKTSVPFEGTFNKIFGQSMIELIQADKPGKKIYEGRFWGDPGFIHLCFDIQGMDRLKACCDEKKHPFTVDSNPDGKSFDMGEAAGHFSYIEDPDGTLIEFVETHKVPVMKKMGWYLDLSKKKQKESLPVWMIKALRFSRIKKVPVK